jgi:hypothetical protein
MSGAHLALTWSPRVVPRLAAMAAPLVAPRAGLKAGFDWRCPSKPHARQPLSDSRIQPRFPKHRTAGLPSSSPCRHLVRATPPLSIALRREELESPSFPLFDKKLSRRRVLPRCHAMSFHHCRHLTCLHREATAAPVHSSPRRLLLSLSLSPVNECAAVASAVTLPRLAPPRPT